MDRKTYRVALAALCAQASLLHVQLAVVGAGHEVDQVDVPVVLVPGDHNDDGDDDDYDNDDGDDDDDDEKSQICPLSSHPLVPVRTLRSLYDL